MKSGEMTRGTGAQGRAARDARGGEFAGLFPFGAGIFLAVLVVKAMLQPPRGTPRGTAALAEHATGAAGGVPVLLVALVLGLLGARWFLVGRPRQFWRHLAGSVGIALGISLFLGGFSDVAGGAFGAFPRAVLGPGGGLVLGILAGVAIVAGSAWTAWFQGSAAFSWRKWKTLTHGPSLDGERAAGVTPEEARALLPRVPPPPAEEGVAPKAEEPAAPLSPYPDDVRRRGEIPTGARPLTPPKAQIDDLQAQPAVTRPRGQDDAPAVYRWTPAASAAAGDAVGGDLAAAAGPSVEPHAPSEQGQRELGAPPEVAARERPAPGGPAPPLAPRFASLASGATPMARPVAPPRPSWEEAAFVQEELFERSAPVGDSEPTSASEVLADPPAGLDGEEELEAGLEDDLEDEWDGELAAGLDDHSEDADWSEELEEEEDVEEVGELEEELAAVLEQDEELVGRDELLAGARDELADESSEAEGESEGLWNPDDEESEESEELEAEDDHERAAELEGELEDEPEDEPEYESEEGAELEPRSAPAAAAPRVEPVAAEDDEPVVVIAPQAAPEPRASRHEVPADLVVDAGCLFLERNRVAVSMLQRQFGLDFEQSCAVLDELQERGLIGPYLGGKSRDLLMSLDEWLEVAGRA